MVKRSRDVVDLCHSDDDEPPEKVPSMPEVHEVVDLCDSDDEDISEAGGSNQTAVPIRQPDVKKVQQSEVRGIARGSGRGQAGGKCQTDEGEARLLHKFLGGVLKSKRDGQLDRDYLLHVLRQLEALIPSKQVAQNADLLEITWHPHGMVCYGAWDEDTVAARLPARCGGSSFICTDCLAQYCQSQISSGDVTPWITTPAVKNDTVVPLDILESGLSDETLSQFAVEHLCRMLPRHSAWVECMQKECRYGFIITGEAKRLCCGMCGTRQMVSCKAIEQDRYLARLVKDGSVRLCPRCREPTMKDKGICNVIQCGKCSIWWNWRSRDTGNTSVELKDKARLCGTLWEPGELEYQMNLQRSNLPAFKQLLERNGQQYNPKYQRGGF